MVEKRREGVPSRRVWWPAVIMSVLAALVVAGTSAGPAQAADSLRYLKNDGYATWAFGSPSVGRALTSSAGGEYPEMVWRYQPRSTLNGHPLVKFQNNYNGRCLDSHASTTQVWIIGCNTGSYQLWEVFVNSDGSHTYKSYGAWVNQRAHVCMVAQGVQGYLNLTTCNATAGTQQWRSLRS